MTPIFLTSITKGTIHFSEEMLTYFHSRPDGEYELILRKPKKDRSSPQNKYFHGYIVKEISDFTGFTPEETKDLLKLKFLKTTALVTTKKGNIEIEFIKPTSSLSTVEFEQLCTEVREWASIKLELYLSLPNEIL